MPVTTGIQGGSEAQHTIILNGAQRSEESKAPAHLARLQTLTRLPACPPDISSFPIPARSRYPCLTMTTTRTDTVPPPVLPAQAGTQGWRMGVYPERSRRVLPAQPSIQERLGYGLRLHGSDVWSERLPLSSLRAQRGNLVVGWCHSEERRDEESPALVIHGHPIRHARDDGHPGGVVGSTSHYHSERSPAK